MLFYINQNYILLKAIEVYISLLKLKFKEKDYSVIIENLTKLLSDSSLLTDQVRYLLIAKRLIFLNKKFISN